MSIYKFEYRQCTAINKNKWDEYLTYKEVNCEEKQWDDDKYDWKMVYLKSNDEKYGRIMISVKYKLRRGLTKGEFYGSGIVD